MYKYKVNQENKRDLPVAVVLGGTVPHKNLLAKLKERGYYTVLIDYFDNPPAAESADVHCVESAMDLDVVTNVAKENNAEVILSSCLDQQMNIAMRAAETLGLAHPFGAELTERVTNKRLMKRIMMEGGIPTSRYYIVDEFFDLSKLELTYPVIVKPVDSCGSAGVVKLESSEKLKETVKTSMEWSRDHRAVVEEFVEGTELSVHCYVEAGKAKVLFTNCKIAKMEGKAYQQMLNLYMPQLDSGLQKELERVADLIVEKFELPSYTPMFMQVIVKEGKVSVIEFSPRIAGGLASYISENYAGFDLLNYSIDSYLGMHEDRGNAALKNWLCNLPIYCTEGVFAKVSGTEQLIKEGIVKKLELLKVPGDHVDMEKPSSSNVCKYLIEGDSAADCFRKASYAKAHTDCLDVSGKSIINRTFVLTEEEFNDKVSALL